MSIRIATGIARRDNCVLLVASMYANHPEPLWTLPGGRQERAELASETVVRELREETGLRGRVVDFAYASESYDDATHVANLTFVIEAGGEPNVPRSHDHVVAAEWVPMEAIRERMAVAVVRRPRLAGRHAAATRYFGYHEAGVTIQWLD